jgi:hypothetical protein
MAHRGSFKVCQKVIRQTTSQIQRSFEIPKSIRANEKKKGKAKRKRKRKSIMKLKGKSKSKGKSKGKGGKQPTRRDTSIRNDSETYLRTLAFIGQSNYTLQCPCNDPLNWAINNPQFPIAIASACTEVFFGI